jgi:hypothetical protein
MYAGRGLPLVSAMLTIWNQITTKFYGRSVYGSYVIEGDADGENATRQKGDAAGEFQFAFRSGVAICVSWRRKERQFSSSLGLPQQPGSSAQFTGRS